MTSNKENIVNYKRIYEYRFKNINRQTKNKIWKVIAEFIYKKLEEPEIVIDPAAGECEFINAIPAKEKWAIDLNKIFLEQNAASEVKKIAGNCIEIELPKNYFDAVFVSNFVEHLNDGKEVTFFLEKMHSLLKKDGKIVIMGPNFKYCAKNYFDFADHNVIITETSMAEYLYGAGFEHIKIYPKFLPLSFRGNLPINKFLTRMYLCLPVLWNVFGRQYLLFGTKM